jgi:hypothetical protein
MYQYFTIYRQYFFFKIEHFWIFMNILYSMWPKVLPHVKKTSLYNQPNLSQGRNQPLFYTFVKNAYAFRGKDDDCIWRMCEARFRKSLEMSHDTEATSSKRKFRKYDTAIDTSCAPGGLPSCTRWQFDFGGIFQKRGVHIPIRGPQGTKTVQ